MTAHPAADTGRKSPIVYVREADPAILPNEMQGVKAYAVHDEAGTPLAVAPDRAQAFALARQNDLTPLSVH